MPMLPGDIVDQKYRVLRRIGLGSMGTVYECESLRLGRRVAIKIMHSGTPRTPELVARFEREAQVAARVASPHVCSVLDLGDLPEGNRYIVMEYLDGITLEQFLEAYGCMDAVALAPIAYELLEGLAALHEVGIIHRDLKPANVFLARTGQWRSTVKILDFGISKLTNVEMTGCITAAGSVVGTPLYMSPEQARGSGQVDARADLYSVGVILYRCLTGHVPFSGENFNQVLFRVALEEPPAIESYVPDADPEFCGIVRWAMARNRDQRIASARALQSALVEWGRRTPKNGITSDRNFAPLLSNGLLGEGGGQSSQDWARALAEGWGTPAAWVFGAGATGAGSNLDSRVQTWASTGVEPASSGKKAGFPHRLRVMVAVALLVWGGGYSLYLGFLGWFGAMPSEPVAAQVMTSPIQAELVLTPDPNPPLPLPPPNTELTDAISPSPPAVGGRGPTAIVSAPPDNGALSAPPRPAPIHPKLPGERIVRPVGQPVQRMPESDNPYGPEWKGGRTQAQPDNSDDLIDTR